MQNESLLQTSARFSHVWGATSDFAAASWSGTVSFKAAASTTNDEASANPATSHLAAKGAVNLYEAVAFVNRQFGRCLNTHIVPAFGMMGLSAVEGAAVVSLFNHEAAKWLRGRGEEHVYVYVHEQARDKGFHTHLLAHVPHHLAKDFTAWATGAFARLAGRPLTKEDVYVQVEARGRVPSQLSTQWNLFRYMTKSLDPAGKLSLGDGRVMNAAEVFGMKRLRATGPVECQRRYGMSTNIGAGARKAAGFRSALSWGELHELFEGKELVVHSRQKEMEEIQSNLRLLHL